MEKFSSPNERDPLRGLLHASPTRAIHLQRTGLPGLYHISRRCEALFCAGCWTRRLARADGGAVHTAGVARREGRPVLVVKWPDDHASSGNRQLVSRGGLSVSAEEGPAAALAAAMKAVTSE